MQHFVSSQGITDEELDRFPTGQFINIHKSKSQIVISAFNQTLALPANQIHAILTIMDSQDRGKLNRLLKNWPRGTVAVQTWLEGQGIYRQLADVYTRSTWLTRIGRGAYIRSGETVDWSGGLYAIQEQMQLAVHVGAKTALQLHGISHYLPLSGQDPLYLSGAPGTRLPAWFTNYDWNRKIHYTTSGLFREHLLGMTTKDLGEYALNVATAERAMMEVLHFVPGKESLQEADHLMAGLTTLRPTLVQALLESCNSIKVKRLFMYLAEKNSHRWVEKLDLTKVAFGTGKRVVIRGGRLDPRYQITVLHDDNEQRMPEL